MARFVMAAAAALLLSACAAHVRFESTKLAPTSAVETTSGLFQKPAGEGRHPAVVLLHTCGGMGSHVALDWPAILKAQGYATLTIDTGGARSMSGNCIRNPVMQSAQIRDAWGALDYLAGRPDIDARRIAVMGFSMGAFAVPVFTGDGSTFTSPRGHSYAAAIAVYGSCSYAAEPRIPVLQIIGDRDYNSRACTKNAVPKLQTEILPGATHAFDQQEFAFEQNIEGGYRVVYNAAATRRAHARVLAFLADSLPR